MNARSESRSNSSPKTPPAADASPGPNAAAGRRLTELADRDPRGGKVAHVAGAEVWDFGVDTTGTLAGGLELARLCLADLADVVLVPCDPDRLVSNNAVYVRTDAPLLGCLGCQYAGWPVKSDDFFAMGSGPMRLLRGREDVLREYALADADARLACGVLESDQLPTPSAIAVMAEECGLPPESIRLAVAPSSSIAGSVQVVSRSVETAMHKLHSLHFDVGRVVSATGCAPLPPPAKKADTVGGIGRTNDAMLYGATVTLWVDCEDQDVESVYDRVPSSQSRDHGRPFAQIFADYDHDFYAVDPALFSPAVVTMHNLRSGKTFSAGQVMTDVLRESFGV
ncbi:methenyltetrahydromethanopterin cyclohydrolase [Roseiconus nitratireducens]|uniref:Methenyltetrahydromethanopterin cyclohydrolase n=1 Tax=Roseiconus nitratireducens TaxID=2605748 RepID=A0A5M6D2G3_9BACT|nr:methenyltetrahydromethanopterin cyclohydrolase [Roseiconus nitratireducens]KAA5539849.1 methenyltetrahydromethanopterin cyclohydrolase [Roseiconus nitratireducens]